MMKRGMSLLIFLLAGAWALAGELPAGLVWETNTTDTLIGSPDAIKGGTLRTYMDDYPLTFRLMGPNSNDAFALFNRAYTMGFSLVARHPISDRFIPWMATHWSVQPDNRTIYFKLQPEARWSDGQPITADDFVFTYEMMSSPDIVDPFYNNYAQTYFESVEAIDAHTLKIVGKQPSWRPLDDYTLYPTARHSVKLGPDWVKEANNTWPVTSGPYVITQAETGKKVVFEKVKDWWGTDQGYFKGLFNVDRIEIQVIPMERALDYFQNGELDFFQVATAKVWAEKMNFEALQKGWAHKKRIFVDVPSGVSGLHMNLTFPLFQNKDLRKAMQYLFNFDKLNKNLMDNAYYRQVSAFTGTEYENKDLKPYGFDPRKAREHLAAAGFTKRGDDGILVNDKGERASFTVIYGSKTFERHMTVVQQDFRRAGVEMNLKLLDGATAFNRGLERKYEMCVTGRTAGFYPEPYQYFHSDFVKETNNNNIWGFGTPHTDELIDIYRFDMDKQKRLAAMAELDQIVQDEAFYIPFWSAPYVRFVYWDNVCWPENYLPKRASTILDYEVYWIDPAKTERLKQARANGTSLGEDTVVDVDPWGVKAALEANAAAQPSMADEQEESN